MSSNPIPYDPYPTFSWLGMVIVFKYTSPIYANRFVPYGSMDLIRRIQTGFEPTKTHSSERLARSLVFFVAVSRGMGNQMWFVLSNGNFNGILEVQFSRFRVDRVFVKVTFLRHRKTKGSWSWGSIGPREWSLSYCIHYRLLVLLQKERQHMIQFDELIFQKDGGKPLTRCFKFQAQCSK